MRLVRFLAAGMIALLASACSPDAQETKTMQTDVEVLSRFMTLPALPAKAQYGFQQFGTQGGFGPDDSQIVAVIEFSAADAPQVAAVMDGAGPPKSRDRYVLQRPDWLADPQIDGVRVRDGVIEIDPGNASSAAPFFSSPYLDGIAVKLDGARKVLVILHTS